MQYIFRIIECVGSDRDIDEVRLTDFTLSYRGRESSNGELDFYDAAKAMLGFQRSLALTAHLVQNGEIITQAPSLKNARILVSPPNHGSWEVVAGIAFAATAGGALIGSKDSRAGRLTRQIYDYVLRSTLGQDADFDKTFQDGVEDELTGKEIREE